MKNIYAWNFSNQFHYLFFHFITSRWRGEILVAPVLKKKLNITQCNIPASIRNMANTPVTFNIYMMCTTLYSDSLLFFLLLLFPPLEALLSLSTYVLQLILNFLVLHFPNTNKFPVSKFYHFFQIWKFYH